MKTNLLGLLIGLASAALAGTAAASDPARDDRVSVTFIRPDHFTDLGSSWQTSDREREGILRELGAAMRRSAASYLREDFQLEIKVKDIDLAGDFEGWHRPGFNDVRFMRDVYPPRMTIEYRLRDPRGRVLREGESKISNPDYLFGVEADSDALRHDKALFRDWISTEFAEFRK